MATNSTTVTVTRGKRVTTEYLDEEEVQVIQYVHVPATLHDIIPSREPDGSGTKGQARCVGRIRSLTPRQLLVGDIIENEQTGATYEIISRKSISLSGGGTRLELVRISGKTA